MVLISLLLMLLLEKILHTPHTSAECGVERPESVLVLPVGQKNNVILIGEYDPGTESWL